MAKRFIIPLSAFLLGSTFIASFYIGILTCAPVVVTKYQKRISGPLLDRIDIHIEVPRWITKN